MPFDAISIENDLRILREARALGAIIHVSGPILRTAIEIINRWLVPCLPRSIYDLSEYNDTHTKAEILALFDRAILAATADPK